jgi:hypothetical protein
MTRIKTIGLTLLAVSAFGAIAASAAQAEEAPFWSVNGSRLKAGETRNITSSVTPGSKFLIKMGTDVITCTAFKLKVGVLLGSNAGEPGTSDEVVVFEGCTIAGNGTPCNVANGKTITTENVKSELVENSAKKQLLTEFFPAAGVIFANLKFEGTGCEMTETKVEGSVAAEALTEKGAVIELPGPAESAVTGKLKFPATSIKKIWLIKGGTGSEVAVALKSFGVATTLEGEADIKLASGEKWSALP